MQRSAEDYLNLPYEKQIALKQERLEKLLGKFGKVKPVISMAEPLHYRNKVHAVFGRDARGRILCGEYKEGTHKIIEREDSPIEDRICRDVIRTIRKMVIRYKIHVYDEDLRTGLLRHVIVRRGFRSGEIMVILVCASPVFPSSKNFVKELRDAFPLIKTIVLNVNNRKTSTLLGDQEKVLFGRGYITDTICGCTFRISADSFFQVNPVQTEILYGTAIEYANLRDGENALDAYCGTGTIGIIAAKACPAAHITGVELNRDAVADARENAKANQLTNIRFTAADASQYLERYTSSEKSEKLSVLFMDPPRSGSDERFLLAAAAAAPERIVYISCGPESLARDLSILVRNGYRVNKIQPVDMFPFSSHVETVCLLTHTS
ncbi:MAG: 23S rRNA (uracil(1939)-C(5))-methyltransferase RlmD [Lachnospiraceae bacterium]|nr:23S rRNA (uracil(1939)-C(5))-methyltransferase RlmD [Lachnospiraceae bacterium]